MRAALICIAHDDEGPVEVAGRSLALRQLDFAQASACERIIILGNGAATEAIALRQAAERRGLKVSAIGNPRGLAGLLSPSDDLLVMQSRLLPASPDMPTAMAGDPGILILPGDLARPGGFERIDLQRAWGGAMVLPAGLIDRLQELDEDFDAPSTLLRLALQYGVREKPMPVESYEAGTWAVVTADKAADYSRDWLARSIAPVSAYMPSRWLSRLGVKGAASRLVEHDKSPVAIATIAVLATIGSIIAAYDGHFAVGFAGTGVAVLFAHAAAQGRRLLTAPFGKDGRFGMLTILPDLALLAISVMAIEGEWYRQAFAPLILFTILRLLPFGGKRGWMRILRDRVVIAVGLSLAALFGVLEQAVMAAALLALLPNLRIRAENRG